MNFRWRTISYSPRAQSLVFQNLGSETTNAMDRRAKWIVLIALVLSNYAYPLDEITVSTVDNTTSPSTTVNMSDITVSKTTKGEASKGALARVGQAVGSVFKAIIKGIEYAAKGVGMGLTAILNGSTIVWRQLMTAGVYIFHADHKALIVVYRLLNKS